MALQQWPKDLLPRLKNPGKSFYLSVNRQWLNHHKIPEWKSEYSISDQVTEQTDKELLKILDDMPKVTNYLAKTPKEHIQIMGHIFKNRKIETEETYIQICIRELLGFSGNADIGKFIGWMISSSIPTIIGLNLKNELRSPFFIRATLTPGSLFLPLQYYLNPGYKNSEVWKAYEEYISVCSIELGLPFLYKAIEAEISLAKIVSDANDTLLTKKGRSLKSWMPEFEWSAFMTGLDISNWENRIWNIDASEQFKKILKWICSVDKELIIAVVSLHLIGFSSIYLRPSIKEAYYNIFNKSLLGVNKLLPEKRLMLYQIKSILPDALCDLYSKEHHDLKMVKDIKGFVYNLHQSAIKYMDHTDLLKNKTKVKIIEKLRRMKFIIGNSKLSEMPQVNYTSESIIHAISSLNSARVKHMLSSTGKTKDTVHEDYPCFITNASYYEESNDIMLPWGILKYPFYINRAPLGWNHGGLGATISHEITHAFDLKGSLFTPTGRFKEWWTRKDRRKFKRQTRKITKFFGKFTHYSKKLNGIKTASENWADLGGIHIALYDLKNELSKMGAQESEVKEAYRNFFISYAFSWSTVIKKKALLYAMVKSVHAPSEDRVDRIVPHFQEWVEAFDIKEGDPLYLEPGKRLKFF